MADSKWKTHLQPNVATVTESIFVTGTLLDILVQYGLIDMHQRGRIDLAGIERDKATKLFEVLARCSPGSFDKFCQALDKTSQRHLAELLRSEADRDLSSSQDEYDSATTRQNNPEGISTLRERQSAPERSHVSGQTERRRNEEETNNRLFYVLLLLSIGAAGVYVGYPKTSSSSPVYPKPSSSTNSFPDSSLYDAPWNDFSRIICEAGLSKWQDIGDRLGYDWQSLQVIRESGQGSERDCRALLAKYIEKNGDSKEARKEVVDACVSIQIGGRLKDIAKRNGYLI